MNLKQINSCINCENLTKNFMCQKHDKHVDITTLCDSHKYKVAINRNSSCSNCFNYGLDSCSNKEEASSNMICFDWQTK